MRSPMPRRSTDRAMLAGDALLELELDGCLESGNPSTALHTAHTALLAAALATDTMWCSLRPPFCRWRFHALTVRSGPTGQCTGNTWPPTGVPTAAPRGPVAHQPNARHNVPRAPLGRARLLGSRPPRLLSAPFGRDRVASGTQP